VCLFVRIHGGKPFDVKAHARRVVGKYHTKALKPFEDLYR
jgi:hypothetical protein